MMTTHADFQKRFKRKQKVFTWTWRLVLGAMLAFWIAMGFGAYKLYNYLDFSHGLKGVVEQVWYGNE